MKPLPPHPVTPSDAAAAGTPPAGGLPESTPPALADIAGLHGQIPAAFPHDRLTTHDRLAMQHYADDEIDLLELFKVVWEGKWWILLATLLLTGAGVYYALQQTHVYEAQAVLAPAAENQNLSSAARLGGLAALAGIQLGSGGGSGGVGIAMETLKSRAFLIDFIHRHDLLVPLFALDSYDRNTGTWQIDRTRYDPDRGEWLSEDTTRSPVPTDWEAYRAFTGILSVNQSRDNGMIQVSVTFPVPELARDWVQLLVQDINAYMRDRAIQDGERTIQYLEGQIARTSAAGMQQVFYQLIEEEMKTIMLANVREEYMFRTLDPAMVPETPSGPNRRLIVMVAFLLGGMLGVFGIFIRHMVRSHRASAPQALSGS